MTRRRRVAPDDGQPLLETDVDTFDGESAYDIGKRHALAGAPHFTGRLPKNQHQLYSRGYARGVTEREKGRWDD